MISIVIVNGLDGHPRQTWTSEGPDKTSSTWLEQYLPKQIPQARVMAFGYDCKSTGGNSFVSDIGLSRAAEALLVAIKGGKDPLSSYLLASSYICSI